MSECKPTESLASKEELQMLEWTPEEAAEIEVVRSILWAMVIRLKAKQKAEETAKREASTDSERSASEAGQPTSATKRGRNCLQRGE